MPAPTSSPRPSAWEWVQAALLAANLAWTTLCLGGFLPPAMVLSSALTCALLAVHLLQRATAGEGTPRANTVGWWLLPFLVYAAANVLYVTPVRWLGWFDWYNWAQMIATFWVVANGVRSRGPRVLILATFAVLAVVSVLLACYQRFVQPDWLIFGGTKMPQYLDRASGPFRGPNSLGGFLILLLPPCLALCFRPSASAPQRVFFGWLAVVFAFGLVLTISRGAWIACTLALVAWPLLLPRWRWQRRVAFGFCVLVVVAIAGGTLYRVSPKSRERLQQMVQQAGELSRPIFWRAAWQIFRTHPAVGGGAGSFNSRFEEFRPEREQTTPLWAHNEYLNTLSDYGAIGGVLFFGGCGLIAWRVRRGQALPVTKSSLAVHYALDDPVVAQGFIVGLVAFAFQLFVDFHLKVPALGLAVATLAGLQVKRRDDPRGTVSRVGRILSGVGVLVVAIAGVIWIVPMHRAEGIRDAARREVNRLTPEASAAEMRAAAAWGLSQFQRAASIDAGNSQAWADSAYALAILGHVDESRQPELGRAAEAFARKALVHAPTIAEFWIRLGVALDMQGRWLEAGDAFTRALELAPTTSQTWFYQAYHLALNPVTRRLAQAAVATCLRLDPSSREGDTLRRNLAAGR